MIVESVSPSGNCVTFLGSGRVLAKVHELVTIKVGRDKGGLLGVFVTTATSIASAWAGGVAAAGAKGAVAKTVAATSAKALTGAVGGMAQLAHNELMNTPAYSESTQFMTFHEFRHKYLFGKDYPITL
jgi:hypothetical protein